MLIRTSLVVALAALCSGPLSAQICSGGVDGGMDAQGCDCNDPPKASIAPDANVGDVAWTHAIDAYDAGDYTEAIANMHVAAEHGHPAAAEMLALMYRFGEHLYGMDVHADAAEAAHFTALAVTLRRHTGVPSLVGASPSAP